LKEEVLEDIAIVEDGNGVKNVGLAIDQVECGIEKVASDDEVKDLIDKSATIGSIRTSSLSDTIDLDFDANIQGGGGFEIILAGDNLADSSIAPGLFDMGNIVAVLAAGTERSGAATTCNPGFSTSMQGFKTRFTNSSPH
jgi:hypothetical protein